MNLMRVMQPALPPALADRRRRPERKGEGRGRVARAAAEYGARFAPRRNPLCRYALVQKAYQPRASPKKRTVMKTPREYFTCCPFNTSGEGERAESENEGGGNEGVAAVQSIAGTGEVKGP
jgi:hypothetical protein